MIVKETRSPSEPPLPQMTETKLADGDKVEGWGILALYAFLVLLCVFMLSMALSFFSNVAKHPDRIVRHPIVSVIASIMLITGVCGLIYSAQVFQRWFKQRKENAT